MNQTNPPPANSGQGNPPQEQALSWAREAMKNQNWQQATARWAVLRRAYPKHMAAWIQGGYAHLYANELEKANELFTTAKELFPDHPNPLLGLAACAVKTEDLPSAETYLLQARADYPDNLQTWVISTDSAIKQKNREMALFYNQKARERAGDSPQPFIQYAEMAMKEEQWQDALERWALLREKFPNHPAGYFRAADAANQLNQHRLAKQLILAKEFGLDTLKQEDITPSYQSKKLHSSTSQLLEFIWTKARFNLLSEARTSKLSFIWWILEPLLHMVVYYIVFGLLLKRGGENYPVFLLSGLVPWMWFMKSVSMSTNSILQGQNLILEVGLPSVVFPLVSILQATLKQIPVFLLLLVFMTTQDIFPDQYWWALIPVILVQALFTMSVGCIIAAIIPFIRDLNYLVPTALTFVMFLSGIFYDYKFIPVQWHELFLLNPAAFLVNCYREIFINDSYPDMFTLGQWGLVSGIAFLLVFAAYQRLRYIYPRIILQ